jgi:hypothetical protein
MTAEGERRRADSLSPVFELARRIREMPEIKACEKFTHRHIDDIPRNKF